MTRKVDVLFCPLLFEALGVGSVTSVSPVPPCAESVVLACSRCYMHVGSCMCFGFQLSLFVLCGRQFNILAVVALPTFRSHYAVGVRESKLCSSPEWSKPFACV